MGDDHDDLAKHSYGEEAAFFVVETIILKCQDEPTKDRFCISEVNAVLLEI
jgi:hypothetical protein